MLMCEEVMLEQISYLNIIFKNTFFLFCLCPLCRVGAMQTPEAGADSSSTVPLQTSVPVQPAVTTQQVPTQVPVQQQVSWSPVPTSPPVLLFLAFICLHVCSPILAGTDCSTGAACVPVPGAVRGGEQQRLHQRNHVSAPTWKKHLDIS